MKKHRFLIAFAAGLCLPALAQFATSANTADGNLHDLVLKGVFEAREKDWRNGAIVYQVLPDRFAPSANLAAKKHLYPAPKILRGWDETPKRGTYVESAKLWSHEIEFWGGDLVSLAYSYTLSKRTNAYASYATLRNNARGVFGIASAGATIFPPSSAGGADPSGFALGVRHSF